MRRRVDHAPDGDPCRCGRPADVHRVKHRPHGDPCTLCGLTAARHRTQEQWTPRQTRPKRDDDKFFVGIDGEGRGRTDHKYVLLAAGDEDNMRRWYIEREQGLSTRECLEFILDELPGSARIFSFSFGYDLTMMLRDLPENALYRLFRPELRQRPAGSKVREPYAVCWEEFRLNLQGTKFTVTRDEPSPTGNGKIRRKRRVVWDIFKFYQSKFTAALLDWKVGLKEKVEEIARMKDQRGDFDKISMYEVREYCFAECGYLAQLARRLVDAAERANLELTSFYGAGSLASAMLGGMGIKEKRREPPDEMHGFVASAFFGGRFEHSVVGPIEGPVWSYDISSAYPYCAYSLPCLEHGEWSHTTDRKRIEAASTALVRYTLNKSRKKMAWGPFPFREQDGTITFPGSSGGGWVWRDEYLAGERHFDNVQFEEAYILESSCDCQPFRKIAEYYAVRLAIGKEGPGIVIKLAVNSCYGKLAQSVGVPPFQSWVWAGLITSGTRAMILDMMAMHKDRRNLLAIATDGIYTREKLDPPRPIDTGTFECRNEKGERADKPLGGWERKVVNKGVFFARPGIYFPLNPTDDEIKQVRARGLGRAALHDAWRSIAGAWERGDMLVRVDSARLVRFCGAKTSISMRGRRSENPTYVRAPTYGQWIPRPVIMSLDPRPKRDEKIRRRGAYGELDLLNYPKEAISAPYKNSLISAEAIELRAAQEEAYEQPDGGDYVEYES